MPISVPVPARSPGDLLTSALWNAQVKDNINKLLDRGHRVLTVAQFNALTGLEDGDEVYLEVDSSNGIQWHLRYHLATTKWRVLGGPSLEAAVVASEGTSSATYADLATVGPSVTAPLAGVYDIEEEVYIVISASGGYGYAAAKLGAAATADTEAIVGNAAASAPATVRRTPRRTLAASDVVKLQYKSNSGGVTQTFSQRLLALRPVRIG